MCSFKTIITVSVLHLSFFLPLGSGKTTCADAYASADKSQGIYSIGTSLIELRLEKSEAGIILKSLTNKTLPGEPELVSNGTQPFFDFGQDFCPSVYDIEELWQKRISGKETASMDMEEKPLSVKKGDWIGFAVGAAGGYSCDETEWITSVKYSDGEEYVSVADQELGQGPIWKYCLFSPMKGCIREMDTAEALVPLGMIRMPSPSSSFLAPGNCPHVNGTYLHPSDSFNALRVWIAPRDGTVTLRGTAKNANCGGTVDLSVIRIQPKQETEQSVSFANVRTLQDVETAQVNVGGRPAVRLRFILTNEGCDMEVHLTAFPGTPIVRLDTFLINTSENSIALPECKPILLKVATADHPGTFYWMTNYGSVSLMQEQIAAGYQQMLNGSATAPLLPWMALTAGDRGGIFVSLEYIGRWGLQAASPDGRMVELSASVTDLASCQLPPGGNLSLPSVVLGVFENTLDDMSRHVYNWQYEYLWDLTNYDHYAKTRWGSEWFMSGLCLQDQFTGRLAGSGMQGVENARDTGHDMLWDDAGWTTVEPTPGTAAPDFWKPRDAPDFSSLLHVLEKHNMDWTLWIAGNADIGQLSNYVGSWGNFEWRTDSVSFPSYDVERRWKQMVEGWLVRHPRCAYHTCAFGGTYAHTFDIQRLSTINYFADYGRSDEINYYASLLDTPDKWVDIVTMWGAMGVFPPDTGRNQLCGSLTWAFMTHSYDAAQRRHNDLYHMLVSPAAQTSDLYDSLRPWPDANHSYDREAVRRNAEIYRYLVSQAVAGRWSFVERPKVEGDNPIYYFQRISHDRKRSCIILKHRADQSITIYPQGLIKKQKYTIGFENSVNITTRSGDDLMTRGIYLKRQKPADVIYLGLPNLPGNQSDETEPAPPGRVLKRYEVNLGYSGIGIYWAAGTDNNWISYYEIARDGKVIGRAAKGLFYFDRTMDYNVNAAYAVRTIDGDGNASNWQEAAAIEGEPLTYAVLGGQFDEPNREGWLAEVTRDFTNYQPMVIVPHQGTRALEYGGNCLQPGGLTGVWMSGKPEESQGKPLAKISRGWQTSTPELASVRTWTAPRPGKIRMFGRAFRDYYSRAKSSPMKVKILLNSESVWPASGWAEIPGGDLVGATHILERDVQEGDKVRFILDKALTEDDGVLAWMPVIQYQDGQPDMGGATVRILCGSKKDYLDSAGNIWSADTLYKGGKAVSSNRNEMEGALPAANDVELYAHGRQGKDFSYDIPVPTGLYTIRLKFAETEKKWAFERPFNLYVNGARELLNYDIVQAARGANKAFERVMSNVVPGREGAITLRFAGGWEPRQTTDEPLIKAIEILPQRKPVVRINCGGDAFVDWNSAIWEKDTAEGPILTSSRAVILATPTIYDYPLYQTAKTGREITYSFLLPAGLYCARLKFAEMWLEEAGQRPLDIEVNGRVFYTAFDPFTAAGGKCQSIDIRAEDLTPDSSGRITIRVKAAGANEAILQGIEIE